MNSFSASADRNLLVGILAVQLEFVSRDQLIAGMNAWILEKSKPLEQILTEQSALTSDEMELLSALVAKHVEKHGHDPRQSLAAVSSVATSIREPLQGLGDADVEASLVQMPATGRGRIEIPETISLGRTTSEGQRFRVLRPHAKGGLGEVFVASDEELHREVALKQIQAGYADDPDSRSRFLLEAQFTGGLEHPGIVPVYGLGQYSDGRPFYAMRFIRGDSLREAIRQFHKTSGKARWTSEQSLQLRKLLGRFIDVCDAIEYAHSRGVLHRDLKPGNVMLGKYGETLVVDWGLAKAVGRAVERRTNDEITFHPSSDSHSEPTQMGRAIGTPAYMSPEQASGRIDLLGTASDVYSLGATLYSLLTGESPFPDDDMASVLHKVERGEFRRPREVSRRVPAPLEAVCLQAMALSPADRYASPHALAEDIEHWLADEPVSAYRDPLSARAARWARRNKTAVTVVSVLGLTALVSVSIGAGLLASANQRIRAAQQLAERNEHTANENFRLARKAVQDYLTTVSQETLLDEPGMQPMRDKLLSSALEYYQDFVQRRANDPQLIQELGDAYFLVGLIKGRIGAHRESLAAFRQAIEIHERRLEQDPDDAELSFSLARCHAAAATSLQDAGQSAESTIAFERANQLLVDLAKLDAKNTQVLHELQSLYSNFGSTCHDQGKLQDAVRWFQQALEIGDRLVSGEDAEGEYRNALAGTHHNLAVLKKNTGELQSAVEHYQHAIRMRTQLVAEFPRNQVYRAKLSLSLGNLANAFTELGRLPEAVEFHQQAIKIREQLVRENPAVPEYHDTLASSYGNLASDYRTLGDLQNAANLAEKAVAIWQRLSEQFPDIVDHRASAALANYNLGNLFFGNPSIESNSGDNSEFRSRAERAIAYYRESIRIYESLVREFPNVPDYQASLANACNNCSSAWHLLADEEQTRQLSDRALQLRERLVAEQPDVPEYRNELASTYFNSVSGDTQRTVKYELLNKSVSLRQSLVDEYPDIPAYRFKLAFSLQGLAMHLFVDGEQQQSLPYFEQVIALTERLHAEFPHVPDYRKMLVQALDLQAAGLRVTGNWQKALESQRRVVAIFDGLLAKSPGQVEFIVARARGIQGIGTCFHRGADYEAALREYGRAVDALQPLAEREPPARAAMVQVLKSRVDVLESLKRYAEAIPDLTRMAELSKSALPVRIQRTRFQALSGDHVSAMAEITGMLSAETQWDKTQAYNVACSAALAVAAVKNDSSLPDERRTALRDSYVQQTIQCLDVARKAGFFGSPREIEHLAKDPDFDSVRDEPAFGTFQKQLSLTEP